MSAVVTYDSNNSGGSFWLCDDDWDKLAAAGWTVHWNGHGRFGDRPGTSYSEPLVPVEDVGKRWLGARACSAAKKFENPADAIAEFERVTGQVASAEGCNCCGPPHSFQYEDADGKTHYASAEVVETRIGFD